MKLSKVAYLLSVAVLGVALSACRNSSKNKSNESSVSSSRKTYQIHDKFHIHKISKNTKFPKKGDWLKDPQGETVTNLTNLQNIPNQNTHGMKLFNTQYEVIAIEKVSSDDPLDSLQPDAKTIFPNSNFPKSLTGKTMILLHIESDFQNATNKALNYDGFSGYAGGEYDWTTDDEQQIDKSNLEINDETLGLTVQPHKTVQDKSMNVILSYGNNIKDAYKKINSRHLTIKTAGVSTQDESQLGGIRTLKLTIK